ncbi:hypothetical protein ACFY36_51045 [Actinoplanes sp. NPDC000266]
MSIYFPAAPSSGAYLVRRALTAGELGVIRDRIHADAAGPRELVDTVVAAVFTALLADLGETYDARAGDGSFERGRYAIPNSQWVVIAAAVTGRAHVWDAAVPVGMDLAALLPGSYEDPAVPAPDLQPLPQLATRPAPTTAFPRGRHQRRRTLPRR